MRYLHDWHIGYSGTDQRPFDAFNPMTPDSIFEDGSLGVSLVWKNEHIQKPDQQQTAA